MKKIFCIAFLVVVSNIEVLSLDPLWSRALSAPIIAGPLSLDDALFTLTQEGALYSLNSKGEFLWIKQLNEKMRPLLTVSSNGFVYTVSEKGRIFAHNTDGLFLWSLQAGQTALFAPIPGKDGRLFIVLPHTIHCVSLSGRRLWSIPIPSVPNLNPILDGNGNLLVPAHDLLFVISPFGETLTAIKLDAKLTALIPSPDGFIFATNNGSLQRVSTRDGADLLWKQGDRIYTSLTYANDSLYSCSTDGVFRIHNATDGSELRNYKSSANNESFKIQFYEDTIFAFTNTQAFVFNESLGLENMHVLSFSIQNPVRLGSDFIVGYDNSWFLHCYRIQTSIKKQKTIQNTETYSILRGDIPSWSLLIDSDQEIQKFFLEVTASLNEGTIGTNEAYFARRLSIILKDPKAKSLDKARAASLLGQLGSIEYQPVLVNFAYQEVDQSCALGLLYGLASLGYDAQGTSFEAVKQVASKFNFSETAVQLAVCDALYAIARYSSNRTGEIVLYLTRFISSSYPQQVKKHALSLIGLMLGDH